MRKGQYKRKCKKLFKKAAKLGVKLQFNPQDFDYKRLNCLWYGGTIACIRVTPRVLVELLAYGDVRAILYDENGQELCYSKDKSNNGAFYDRMRLFIKDDKQLKKFEESGRLWIDYNNWIEYGGIVFEDGKNASQIVDLGMVVDNILDDNILIAIEQALDSLDDIVKEILSQAAKEN